MASATVTINGVHLRMDQIKAIDPLQKRVYSTDGFTELFKKLSNTNYQSQYEFVIWFIGKNGGYRTFRSHVVDFKGDGNFKGDTKFVNGYNSLVENWKQYHNEVKETITE
jgi:hypothetical protein